MQKNVNVFVKRDLLLHENDFEILKEFIKNNHHHILDGSSICSISNQNGIIFESTPHKYDSDYKSYVTSKLLDSNYIFLSIESLKMYLGL